MNVDLITSFISFLYGTIKMQKIVILLARKFDVILKEVKLFAHCSLLVTFCSLLVTFYTLLVTFCSLLVTFCLLLNKKF